MEDKNIIKVGDYVMVQRQGFTKLYKVKEKSILSLGQFRVHMDNVVGEKYHDTFKMVNVAGTRNVYTLEKVEQMNSASNLSIKTSGQDNRNIVADDQSQKLTKEEIEKLISERLSSNNIVENLINNSTSFSSKTEYSQEKYIKKKEKKYFEYIQIRRPTIRLLTQMYSKQDILRTIRVDDLSQILTYANVQSEGDYLLYDSRTCGLMPAAIMNAIGAQTTGRLIYVHPGNECQKTALNAMHFPQEQLDRCMNVNLYSVLRCYYQHQGTYGKNTNDNNTRVSAQEETNSKQEETPKEPKTETSSTLIKEETPEKHKDNPATNDDEDGTGEPSNKRIKLLHETREPKRPGWQYEDEKACAILKNKVDAVIIVAKEHPMNLAEALVNFLKGGRRIVVFSTMKEPLQDLYLYLKSKPEFIYLTMSNNFMRNYQVLPDRTHPHVMMTNGGYILTGYKLNS